MLALNSSTISKAFYDVATFDLLKGMLQAETWNSTMILYVA
mgnify:CR=1 FL=1